MKRKLKLNRETLRQLENQEVQEAAGGAPTTVFTQCPSWNRTCAPSCYITCEGSICLNTCVTC